MNGTIDSTVAFPGPTYLPKIYVKYNDWSWIFTEMIIIFSVVLCLFVLFRLVRTGSTREKVCNRCKGPVLQPFGLAAKKPQIRGIHLHRVCIFTVIFDLFHIIVSQVYMIPLQPSPVFCDYVVMLGVIAYCFSLLGTFTFLWCRQRCLYANPLLKASLSMANRVLSWISIISTYLILLVPAGSMLLWRRYNVEQQECKLKNHLHTLFQNWYLTYTIGYFISQLLLGWLYIDPLLKNKRRIEAMAKTHRESNLFPMNQLHQGKKFQSCIVKSTIAAACCITSDIFSAIAVTLISKSNHQRWTLLIPHCINLNINLLSMIGCFVYWRELLFPYCPKPNDNPTHNL